MHKNVKILQESLNIGREQQSLISHGITGYRQKILEEHKLKEKASPKEKLYGLIRHDKDLGYPHRKILDFLIERYDFDQQEFQEAYFSEIVKACRLGKNKAKQYLEFLVLKGYLRKREDGYRNWYSIDWQRNT